MDKMVEADKNCPICSKEIRSDAAIHEYCKLCGMGIPEVRNVPQINVDDEKTYFFCCDRCLLIYKNNVVKS